MRPAIRSWLGFRCARRAVSGRPVLPPLAVDIPGRRVGIGLGEADDLIGLAVAQPCIVTS
jgi:hypothetical protein